MTDEEIKEMLNGIINNGEKWECRPVIKANNAFDLEEKQNRYNFKYEPYKLGEEIHKDWEYRKVEVWCVFQWYKSGNYHLQRTEILNDNYDYIIMFEGTKEECEKWIEYHTNKTWLDERKSCLSVSFSKEVINGYSAGVTEVCKKVLEDIRTHEGIEQLTKFYIAEIIKDLGVDL